MVAVFQHSEGHRQLWQPLSRKGGADIVTRILRGSVSELVRKQVRSRFADAGADEMKLEAAMQFVEGACMGLLIWWLENDIPYSAEEMQSILRGLTTDGVGRFLADSTDTLEPSRRAGS